MLHPFMEKPQCVKNSALAGGICAYEEIKTTEFYGHLPEASAVSCSKLEEFHRECNVNGRFRVATFI